MTNFEKKIGYISDMSIKNGSVICRVEEKNTPNKEHFPCILGRSSAGEVSVPPINSKVLIERVEGEKIITNILSSPGLSGIEAQQSKDGAVAGNASMSFVFSRDEGNTEESFTIQYTQSGYNITADVEGDITLNSGGDVLIEDNETAKRVATVDHEHEVTYNGGGDNSSSLTTSTDNTTENVNN